MSAIDLYRNVNRIQFRYSHKFAQRSIRVVVHLHFGGTAAIPVIQITLSNFKHIAILAISYIMTNFTKYLTTSLLIINYN